MKAKTHWLTLFVMFVMFVACVSVYADNTTDLQKHLQDRFLNKIFMIRNFYGGTHLVFDSQGNLLEGDRNVGYEGCWSAAQIEIHKLEINKDRLTLRGPRVFGIYDTRTKEISQLERAHQDLQIDIQLDPAQTSDEDSLAAILAKVFLTRDDDLRSLVPNAWIAPESTATSDAYRVGHGVTAPKAIRTPDPQYSEEARKAKYQGSVNLWCVVAPSGSVTQIKVLQCLGRGLDQQAIQALSMWKFEPATKDGQPVAVQLDVSMNFHLY
jgi:TonB family protein